MWVLFSRTGLRIMSLAWIHCNDTPFLPKFPGRENLLGRCRCSAMIHGRYLQRDMEELR